MLYSWYSWILRSLGSTPPPAPPHTHHTRRVMCSISYADSVVYLHCNPMSRPIQQKKQKKLTPSGPAGCSIPASGRQRRRPPSTTRVLSYTGRSRSGTPTHSTSTTPPSLPRVSSLSSLASPTPSPPCRVAWSTSCSSMHRADWYTTGAIVSTSGLKGRGARDV